MAGRLWSMLASGKVRATIGGRYPLLAAAEAHRALEARGTRGSQILIP
jgi:NADPH:quinone reductase